MAAPGVGDLKLLGWLRCPRHPGLARHSGLAISATAGPQTIQRQGLGAEHVLPAFLLVMSCRGDSPDGAAPGAGITFYSSEMQTVFLKMAVRPGRRLEVQIGDHTPHPMSRPPGGDEGVREAEKAVRSTGQVREPLAIGTMESTAAVHLPAILARSCQQYPEVDLSLTTGTTEELVVKVLNYQLDGAFVGGIVQHADIAQEPIFNEELVLVTKDRIESVETIINPTVLVFRRGCTYRAILENWLRETGMLPFKIIEFGTLEAILGCVVAGMGITLYPRSIIAKLNYVDKVKLHKIPEVLGRVPTMFIRRQDTFLTQAMDAFLLSIKQGAKAPI